MTHRISPEARASSKLFKAHSSQLIPKICRIGPCPILGDASKRTAENDCVDTLVDLLILVHLPVHSFQTGIGHSPIPRAFASYFELNGEHTAGKLYSVLFFLSYCRNYTHSVCNLLRECGSLQVHVENVSPQLDFDKAGVVFKPRISVDGRWRRKVFERIQAFRAEL